jgi:2-dehydro-3-deoxygluconokinase
MLRLSVPTGERIQDAPAFDVHVGGSEANVAFALARVGVRSSWASVLPRNPLGERVASVLASGGVDLAPVVWAERGRLGTFFVEGGASPRPTLVVYDRSGSTMAQATPGCFDWDQVAGGRHLHLSGITFAISDSAADVARVAIQEARARGCTVSLDVNHRARLWTPEDAARTLTSLAGSVDLLICKGADAAQLFGCREGPRGVAERLRERFLARTVVCTWGAQPATLLEEEWWAEEPTYRVQMVDRIGAGDAFAAGVLWGFVEGATELGLRRGVAMAALKMTLRGDLFTLGPEPVAELLRAPPGDVRR